MILPQFIENLSPEWQKTIIELAKVAQQLEHGDIVIKVQDRKPVLSEYTIKRRAADVSQFQVIGLGS